VCAACRHLSPWPLGVTTVFPPDTRLDMARVPCTLLRLRAHLTGPPARRGLDMWASPPQQGLGGEVSRWRWSRPCHGCHLAKPLLTGAGPNWARSGVRAAPMGALHELHGDGWRCSVWGRGHSHLSLAPPTAGVEITPLDRA
jgi:hypothetical protein